MLFEEVGVVKALFGSTLSFMPRWKGAIRGDSTGSSPKKTPMFVRSVRRRKPHLEEGVYFQGAG